MSSFTKRSVVEVLLFTIFSFGIYGIYWTVVTKRELNTAGDIKIPNAVLAYIPILSFWFWYCYAQAYAKAVKNNSEDPAVLTYFFISLFPIIRIIVFQSGFNDYTN